MKLNRLLTSKEVIHLLALDVGRQRPQEALRHLRRTRQLAYVKLGHRTVRFRPEDVAAYVAEHTVERV